MEYVSTLQELIAALEYGNRFHISIEFEHVHRELIKTLSVSRSHVIHATPFCDEVKERKGLNPCLVCKGKAMNKAKKTGLPFGGLCVNGVYEFCYPVFSGGGLLCIIFLGNIISDMDVFLEKSGLPADSLLIDTMERGMDPEMCMQICSVLASYIRMLTADSKNISTGKRINATVAAVESYVERYFYLDISLSELANMYHYNEKYLGTLFKKQVGRSFHEYLNGRRLYRARMLLEQSQDSILSIATRVGFNNVTYFNRLFREVYGMSPSQLRTNFGKLATNKQAHKNKDSTQTPLQYMGTDTTPKT